MNVTLRIKVPEGSVNSLEEKSAYEDNTTSYREDCNHYIQENMFLLLQLKLIILFYVSMTFYILSLWLDSLSSFVHIENLYSTFKISSNINPSLDLH